MTITSPEASAIEPSSGTYLLIMASTVQRQIVVGRLGRMEVVPGYYLYVGSAFGPGGIRARLSHHLRIAARPHWHIDYLRKVVPVKAVWCCYEERRSEHLWVELLESMPGLSIPIRGFGASDHPGSSHLFYSGDEPSFTTFRRRFKNKRERPAPLYNVLIPA